MTSRGLKEEDFIKIANIIDKTLRNIDNEEVLNEIKNEVINLTSKFPLNY